MPDKEKVIKGLECCLKESDHLYSNPCNGCPYEGQECIDRMKTDALTLLKEQEAVEPRKCQNEDSVPLTEWWYVCGICNAILHWGDGYCSRCGRKVKWDA